MVHTDLEAFEAVMEDICEEDFYYFINLVLQTKTMFFVDCYSRVKEKLLSGRPNTFNKMRRCGYKFYFVRSRCRQAIEGAPPVGRHEAVFNFKIEGADLDGNRKIYDPDKDILALSYRQVVRTYGAKSNQGLVKFDDEKIFLGMMDFIYQRYIATQPVLASDSGS